MNVDGPAPLVSFVDSGGEQVAVENSHQPGDDNHPPPQNPLSPGPVSRTLRSVRVTSDTGDDNNEPPQLSLFASKGAGLPPVEPRITLEQCLESRALSANHLLTDLQDRVLGNRLNRMSLNARTALSERGVNVLFVAFGFLKWFEAEHSDEPRLSPLLLVPVCLERIGVLCATSDLMQNIDQPA